MNQFSFNPFMYEEIKRQHEELIKQSLLLHKVKEAREGENPSKTDGFNLFAWLGKELSRIGFSIELRYSSQPEAQAKFNQQSNTSGCA